VTSTKTKQQQEQLQLLVQQKQKQITPRAQATKMQLITEQMAIAPQAVVMTDKEKQLLSEQQGMVTRRRAAAGTNTSNLSKHRPPALKIANHNLDDTRFFDDAHISPLPSMMEHHQHEGLPISDGQEVPLDFDDSYFAADMPTYYERNTDVAFHNTIAPLPLKHAHQQQQPLLHQHHNDGVEIHPDIFAHEFRAQAPAGVHHQQNNSLDFDDELWNLNAIQLDHNDSNAVSIGLEHSNQNTYYTDAAPLVDAETLGAHGLEAFDDGFQSIIADLAHENKPLKRKAIHDDIFEDGIAHGVALNPVLKHARLGAISSNLGHHATPGFATPSLSHAKNRSLVAKNSISPTSARAIQHEQDAASETSSCVSSLPPGLVQAPPAVAAAAARLGTRLPYAPAPGSLRDPLAALRAGSSKVAGKRWTPKQDEQLRKAVNKYKSSNWKAIAQCVEGRNHVQCLQRWKKVLQPGLIKGMWSQEEDDKLLMLLEAQGKEKSWTKIAEHIPGRTAKQCRERWHLNLDPSINRGPWTKQEDDILLGLHAKIGNKWAEIKRSLPGRTENGVKSRFKSIQRALNKDTRFSA